MMRSISSTKAMVPLRSELNADMLKGPGHLANGEHSRSGVGRTLHNPYVER